MIKKGVPPLRPPARTHNWTRPLNDELLSSLSQRRASLAPAVSASLASLPAITELSPTVSTLSTDFPRIVDVHRTRGRNSFGGNRDLLSTMPARLLATADSMPLLPSPGTSPRSGSQRRPSFAPAQPQPLQQHQQRTSVNGSPRFLSLSASALPGLHSVFCADDVEDDEDDEYEYDVRRLRPRSFSLSALSSLTDEEKNELASTPLMLHTSSGLITSTRSTPTRRFSSAPAWYLGSGARGDDSDGDFGQGDEAYSRLRRPEQPELKLTLTPMTPLFGSSLPQLSATTFLFSAHEQLEQLIALFPLHYQNFMSTFLFTQLWTVYTDELDRLFAERRSQISLDQLLYRFLFLACVVCVYVCVRVPLVADVWLRSCAHRKEKGTSMLSKSDGAGEEEDTEGDQAINYVTPRNAAKFSEEIRGLIDYEDGQLQSAQSLLQIFEKTPEEEAALDDILLHSSRRLTILSKALDSIDRLLRSPSSSSK
jgi:hypothetical protein